MMMFAERDVRIPGHDEKAFLHNALVTMGFALAVIGFYRYFNPE